MGISEKELLAMLDAKLKYLVQEVESLKDRQIEMNQKLSNLLARKPLKK